MSSRAPTSPRLEIPRAAAPRPVPPGVELDDPVLYFNRELGDIDFNWRVLWQAMDERIPLLERARYLAITASNIDEFFQKRVGGLRRQQAAGVIEVSPDGRTPAEQLELIRDASRALNSRINDLWRHTLEPALEREAGVRILNRYELDEEQHRRVAEHFHSNIYPIVTPLAVDSGRPFPFISNLSLSLAITLRSPGSDEELFVRLKVPDPSGRWFELSPRVFLPLEQVLKEHIDSFFPGLEVTGAYAFRVTRNADIRLDEEEAEDLISAISEELRERRFAAVVRLEVEHDMPPTVRRYLMEHLDLHAEDLYESSSLLGLADVTSFADLHQPEFLFEPFNGVTAPRIAEHSRLSERGKLFELIRQGDLLVHHPYELFATSVQRFIEEAADDPNVLAIKQTLYRTSSQSPTVTALTRAAERGKQVAVLVEVKARFDEQNNIDWGERLEAAGVHVMYGFINLKIHTKIVLVVRREEDGIRTYCHIGTGNYNVNTARLYTDLGLFTSDPEIGQDLINLFHHITGYAPDQHYRHLLVAPWRMRQRYLELIEREIAFQREGRGGRIVAKMNGLDDLPIIQALYRASQEGVQIDLVVRGHSRLRPGIPGYSDNIRVVSIIGRFLEHDRIFMFGNGGDPEVFLGSADWKRRNLQDRIEATVPVRDPGHRSRLIAILEAALADNRLAWDLDSEGVYTQRHPESDEEVRSLQGVLMRWATEVG
jgi:polyphosphate kinase